MQNITSFINKVLMHDNKCLCLKSSITPLMLNYYYYNTCTYRNVHVKMSFLQSKYLILQSLSLGYYIVHVYSFTYTCIIQCTSLYKCHLGLLTLCFNRFTCVSVNHWHTARLNFILLACKLKY